MSEPILPILSPLGNKSEIRAYWELSIRASNYKCCFNDFHGIGNEEIVPHHAIML